MKIIHEMHKYIFSVLEYIIISFIAIIISSGKKEKLYICIKIVSLLSQAQSKYPVVSAVIRSS